MRIRVRLGAGLNRFAEAPLLSIDLADGASVDDLLAALPAGDVLTPEDVAALRAIGDNTGSMTLKGAAPDHEGEPRPDRWALTPELAHVAARWGIEPSRDLQPA